MTKVSHRRNQTRRTSLNMESLETRSMLTVVNLSPVQDTTLYEESEQESVQANGAGRGMFIGANDMNRERRGLIQFDVAAEIPPGSTIRDVRLELHKFSQDVATQEIALHVVTNDWGEGRSNAKPGEDGTTPTIDSATWNFRRYGVNPIHWNSPGGDYTAAESAVQLVQGPGTYQWEDVQMIQDVTDWLNDPTINYGWLLRSDNPSADVLKGFETREAVNKPLLIVDYDPPFGAELEIDDATPVNEGNEGDSNTLTFEVTISQIPLEPVTVNYSTQVDTEGSNPASEDVDFTPQSGQLTFENGLPKTQTIEVPIVGDEINEESETLLVTLSDVQGSAFLKRPEASGEILDDDPLPTLEIAGAEFAEGDEGTINYDLTVTLSEPSSKEVVVKYEHQDDGATWNEDYRTTLPGNLAFAPGETEKTIGVQIIGDTEVEGDEHFLIELFDPINAELGEEKTARVTIIDDDVNMEFPWHNSEWPEDVRGDGNVVPLDALLVINAINNGGAGPLEPPTEPGTPPPFLDVDADNFLSPFDALLVINYLNNPPPPVQAATEAATPEVMDDALLTLIAASTLGDGFQIDEAGNSRSPAVLKAR